METIRFCAAATRGKDLRWGKWDWPLVTSASERAILEPLDAVPGTRDAHQADNALRGPAEPEPAQAAVAAAGLP